jgi:hypothetical protein
MLVVIWFSEEIEVTPCLPAASIMVALNVYSVVPGVEGTGIA